MKQLRFQSRQPTGKNIERERLTSLINSMADGVIAVDQQLKIVVYNGAALNILDLNSSMDGKSVATVFKPIDKHKRPIDIAAYIKGVKVPKVDRDLRLAYGDGSTINIYVSVAPVYRGYGEDGQGGFVLVLRDITREKSLEEERDEFISVASHELRTPIAIAEGNVSNAQYIAGKSANIDEIKAALASAHEQILFLAAMMNDLATLSRAERGKLSVEPEAIDVAALLDSLLHAYKPQAEAKHLTMTTEVTAATKPFISSKLYVGEILQNFLTNALKYTHEGGITLRATGKDDGVLFAVTDTGIGISKGDQARLFEKFFRSEDFRTRSTGGTGLGLYVAKKLAHLLGAEIAVDSTLNQGSTFRIFIPSLRR